MKKSSITELIPIVIDSMKDLGIMDGDNVVVEKRPLVSIPEKKAK